MSFVPRLRRPMAKKDVRFSDSLSETEKRRRKEDAYSFLENRGARTTSYSKPSPILRRHTYELLGESPIRHIQDPDCLGSERVLRSVRKEALKSAPVGSHRHRTTRRGRVEKPTRPTKGSKGILDSLSSATTKLLGSVLFNEKGEDEKLRAASSGSASSGPASSVPTRVGEWNSEELRRIREKDDLERSIRERRAELDQLDREVGRRNVLQTEQSDLESRIVVLEAQAQAQAKSTDSVNRIEFDALKEEVSVLQRRQERDRLSYESRLEEVKMESELNVRNYKRLLKKLEEEKAEAAREKTEMLRMIREVLDEEEDEEDEEEDEEDETNPDDSLNTQLKGMTRKMQSFENDVKQNRSRLKKI